MKKSKRIFTVLFLAVLLISALCALAFALTESEVEAQVAATSKEAVAGNVLIWFLCAVAFLKVSQKIDSFMASLGVNVGHTGGSMLGEAMIAMRAVTMAAGGARGAMAGRAGSASRSAAGSSGGSGTAGFFKGGLIGMAGRHITNSAVKTATTQTSSVHTAQNQTYQAAAATSAAQTGAAAQTESGANINNEVHSGGSSIHTNNSFTAGAPPQDGTIVTGGGASAPASPMENVPSAGSMPDVTPPQEGVILTGSEPPPSIPADPTPQMGSLPPDGAPLDSMPVDPASPDGGVVITGGDTAINAVQTDNIVQSSPEGPAPLGNTAGTGGQHTEAHTERTSQTASHSAVSSERVRSRHSQMFSTGLPTLGGTVFSHSLAAGGNFANDVIGTVARGEAAGSITGDMAAQCLQSYLGYAAQGSPPPVFTDAEIGSGRIAGQVSTPGHPEPIAFGLYHAEQYAEPKGEFTKIRSADGTLWYSQLAQDSVERKPYTAPDGTVAYKERIVKKLPDPPKRKDRI